MIGCVTCGKFDVSLKLSANLASNIISLGSDFVGVLRSFCIAFVFGFKAYGDTGVVVCEILLDLSHVSKFGSLLCNTCGEGEEAVFLGDGLDGRTRGKFWEATFPLGRCLGATLVPSSVRTCCFGVIAAFCAVARFSSLSNGGFTRFSRTGASDF